MMTLKSTQTFYYFAPYIRTKARMMIYFENLQLTVSNGHRITSKRLKHNFKGRKHWFIYHSTTNLQGEQTNNSHKIL